MGKRIILLLSALLLVAGMWIVQYQSLNNSRSAPLELPPPSSLTDHSEADIEERSAFQGMPSARPSKLRQTEAPPMTEENQPTGSSQGIVFFNPDQHPSDWLAEAYKTMGSADPTEIPGKQQAAGEGDLEAAFWMYQYYAECMRGPTTEWQLDAHLARAQAAAEEWLRDNPTAEVPDWIMGRIDAIERRYRLCQAIDPDLDIASTALAWLGAAADGGHIPARFWYYNLAAALITNLTGGYGFPEPHVLET